MFIVTGSENWPSRYSAAPSTSETNPLGAFATLASQEMLMTKDDVLAVEVTAVVPPRPTPPALAALPERSSLEYSTACLKMPLCSPVGAVDDPGYGRN